MIFKRSKAQSYGWKIQVLVKLWTLKASFYFSIIQRLKRKKKLLQTIIGTKKETWGLNTVNWKDQISMYIILLSLIPILYKILHETS